MSEKLKDVGIRDYYHSLQKKDKSKMVAYLMSQFGMNYSTIMGKMSGRFNFTSPDIYLFNLAIQNESEWKQ